MQKKKNNVQQITVYENDYNRQCKIILWRTVDPSRKEKLGEQILKNFLML
jgi:hypothetical protein